MTLIIAEAGVNHNGDIGLAKELVDIASECGADIVKFQTWKTELLVTKSSKLADYQKKNITHSNSQFEMLKKLFTIKFLFIYYSQTSFCSELLLKFN